MNPLNICENCFEAVIPECVTEFKIGGFLPNQILIAYIENFKSNKAVALTADVNGLITVPYEGFSKENSPYIFTFKANAITCAKLPFNQCVNNVSTPFQCLSINFIKVNDPLLYTNQINCQC